MTDVILTFLRFIIGSLSRVQSQLEQGLRSLRDLTQHLTTRADDSHAPPVRGRSTFFFQKLFMSSPGKVLRVASN